MRNALKIGAIVALLYVAVASGLLLAMYQPPETFGKIMSKTPRITFALLPFRPLWFVARRGQLHVGQPAPDFTLPTLEKSAHVKLSSFRGQKPVVLVFGSYT